MVLINEKKYACATCIKGHRVSGCTHTDRPLFEVKKKGRPSTQCPTCRDRRKPGKSVHTKCTCGNDERPATAPAAAPVEDAVAPPTPGSNDSQETRKGQPGSTPSFPNGLKDVHELAAAADALGGLSREAPVAAERSVANLLNPCSCKSTGICRCCAPKKRRPSPPPRHLDAHAVVTDSVIEMFKAKAKASTPAVPEPLPSASGSQTPSIMRLHYNALGEVAAPLMSPSNMFHPAHSSPHVHKTKLYSPYSTNGHSTPRHGIKKDAPAGHGPVRAPSVDVRKPAPLSPPRIRPLADMTSFLGAVFNEDGTIASRIPRSALGLPGITSFDTPDAPAASSSRGGCCDGGEDTGMDVDVSVQFPTSEDVVLGGCACGEGCECPNCLTHGTGPVSPSSTVSGTTHKPHGCGDGCKSSFDCTHQLSIPSGVASIEQLIALAALEVPDNPHPRPKVTDLDPHDTRVLAHAAMHYEDAARHAGLVNVLPLECCNGRCQCPPSACSCKGDCCGCCIECACDHDGDALMADGAAGNAPKSCCSTTPPAPEPPARSCCSTAPATALVDSPVASTSSSARSARAGSSASTSGGATPPLPPLRRAGSVSRAKEASNASSARRTSVSHPTLQRSQSGSKANPAKASAAHAHVHPHPRPILPKPPSASGISRLAGQKASSRPHSPSSSRTGSPPPRAQSASSVRPVEPVPAVTAPMAKQIDVEDLVSTLSQTNGDLMAYISQYLSTNDGGAGASDSQSLTLPNDYGVALSTTSEPASLLSTSAEADPSQDAPGAFDFAAYFPTQPPSLTNDSSASSEVFDPANADISELLAGALSDPNLVASLFGPGADMAAQAGAVDAGRADRGEGPSRPSLQQQDFGPNPAEDFNYHFWVGPTEQSAPLAALDAEAQSPTQALLQRLLQTQSQVPPRPSEPRSSSSVTVPTLYSHGVALPTYNNQSALGMLPNGTSRQAFPVSSTPTWSFDADGAPAPPVNILGPVSHPSTAKALPRPPASQPLQSQGQPAYAPSGTACQSSQGAPDDPMARSLMYGALDMFDPATRPLDVADSQGGFGPAAMPVAPVPVQYSSSGEPQRPVPAERQATQLDETPSNPNLIDLSKPLNQSDVDRILQAIMRQQQPALPAVSEPPPALPPPAPDASGWGYPSSPPGLPAPFRPDFTLGSVLDGPMAGLDMSSFDGELGEFGEFADYVYDDAADGKRRAGDGDAAAGEGAGAGKQVGALGQAGYVPDQDEYATGGSLNFLGRLDGR
ncbi:copper-binding transcription factor [Cryptotrichosporon argae]